MARDEVIGLNEAKIAKAEEQRQITESSILNMKKSEQSKNTGFVKNISILSASCFKMNESNTIPQEDCALYTSDCQV